MLVLRPHESCMLVIVFCDWCSSHNADPFSGIHFRFFAAFLELGRSTSTFKVYVVALAAHRTEFSISSLGSDRLIVAFLKGANHLCPPRGVRRPT